MKHVIIIASFLVATIASTHSNFEKGEQKAFALWEAKKNTKAEQLFERIAAAESNEWLPNYYIAQINSLKTWDETDAKTSKKPLNFLLTLNLKHTLIPIVEKSAQIKG